MKGSEKFRADFVSAVVIALAARHDAHAGGEVEAIGGDDDPTLFVRRDGFVGDEADAVQRKVGHDDLLLRRSDPGGVAEPPLSRPLFAYASAAIDGGGDDRSAGFE